MQEPVQTAVRCAPHHPPAQQHNTRPQACLPARHPAIPSPQACLCQQAEGLGPAGHVRLQHLQPRLHPLPQPVPA